MTKTALFFPGQGSQSIGMMAGFEGIALIKKTFSLNLFHLTPPDQLMFPYYYNVYL